MPTSFTDDGCVRSDPVVTVADVRLTPQLVLRHNITQVYRVMICPLRGQLGHCRPPSPGQSTPINKPYITSGSPQTATKPEVHISIELSAADLKNKYILIHCRINHLAMGVNVRRSHIQKNHQSSSESKL